MRLIGKSTRFHERRKIKIPVEVRYLEAADTGWTETSVTEELTMCGAGFTVSRPVEPKHLINLKLAMPKELRLYDFGKSVYEVWGVIRSVQVLETNAASGIRVKVGTALIGENPPASFERDPATLYELKPVLRRPGFWDFREMSRNSGRYARSFEDRQKIAMTVILETVNEQGQIIEQVEAETQNISEAGMALTAKLTTIHSGYAVVRTTDDRRLLLAKIRGIHAPDEFGLTQMHLEFLGGEWKF